MKNPTTDTVLIPVDSEIAERVEQLAWEKDMEPIEITTTCCLHGLRHHEKAFTNR